MSKLHLTIAAFSALLLLSTAPNDDNLGRLLDRFFATANRDSLFDFLSVLPDEELYLVRWLNDLISDRNLSNFGYWPDLVNSDVHPNFINLTETPSFSPLTVTLTNSTPSSCPRIVDLTCLTPPYSPITPTYSPITPTIGPIFINLTESPIKPVNDIIVVGRRTNNTLNDTSTSSTLPHDNDIFNALTWLNYYNSIQNDNGSLLPYDNDIFNALTWLNYYNSMRNDYSSPWVMRYVDRPGFRSRLSSRSGTVNEELYALARSYCRWLIDHYGWQPYDYVSYDLSYHLLMQLSDQGKETQCNFIY